MSAVDVDQSVILSSYSAQARSQFEYYVQVWSANLLGTVLKLKRVHRAATRLIPDRRRPSTSPKYVLLEWRWAGNDLVWVFKCSIGVSGFRLTILFTLRSASNRRGHHLMFIKPQRSTSLHASSFEICEVNSWNALSAIITFLSSLDIWWFPR